MRRLKNTFRQLLFVLVLLSVGCNLGDDSGLVVSGRVEVDDIHVGSKIGGRVEAVNFNEGDKVKAGDVVVRLDDKDITAQLNHSRAALSQANAQLDLLLAGTREEDIERAEAVVRARQAELDLRRQGFREEEIREAKATLAKAKNEMEYADREYKRAQNLFESNTIPQEQYDKSRTAYLSSKAQYDIAEERLSLYQRGSRPQEIAMAEAQLQETQADLKRLKSGPRLEEISAQRAQVEQAEANVARLETQLEETRIIAPLDSIVETLDLNPGDLVKAGETAAVLNLATQPWVRCYVPENRLGWLKPGGDAEVTIDSFPDKIFSAKILRISSEAEFTPRNVQTTEKRSELVFETKVGVTEGWDKFRAGMYADVRIVRSSDRPE